MNVGDNAGIVLRFDHWWGAALLWASAIPRRWGYGTPGMSAWLTGSVPYVPGRHEVEQDLHLVEAAIHALAPGTFDLHAQNAAPARAGAYAP